MQERKQTTGPVIQVSNSQAILFEPPKPRVLDTYAKNKYYQAQGDCCTFDAADCILMQDKNLTTPHFDKIRNELQKKYLEYANCHIAIQTLFNKETAQATLSQWITKILTQKTSFKEYLMNMLEWYQLTDLPLTNKKITYSEFLNQNLSFLKNGCRPFVVASISNNLLGFDYCKQQEFGIEDKLNSNPDLKIMLKVDCYNMLQKTQIDELKFEKELAWKPSSKIDDFMAILKNRGLLLVAGFYHKGSYQGNLVKRTIGNQIYLAREKGTNKNEHKFQNSHMVVVVGASKAGYQNTPQDLVYYVDPAVDHNVKTLPIYIMSYKNFCTRLVKGLSGVIQQVAEEREGCFNDYAYAYYHPAFTPVAKLQNSPSFWNRKKCENTALNVSLAVGGVVVTYLGFAAFKS